MSLDLFVCRQNETDVCIRSRDLPSGEFIIPCTSERQLHACMTLNTLVLEAYQAGQRNGRFELRQTLCDLLGAEKRK